MEFRAVVQRLGAIDEPRKPGRWSKACAATRPSKLTLTIRLGQFRRAQRVERFRHAPVVALRINSQANGLGLGPGWWSGSGRHHAPEHAAEFTVADQHGGLHWRRGGGT